MRDFLGCKWLLILKGLEWFERHWRKFSRGDESEVAESRKVRVVRRNHNGVIVLIFVGSVICELHSRSHG